MTTKTANWNRMPWSTVRPGVESKAFSAAGGTVTYNRLSPGHEPSPHSHPHEQVIYIAEGEVDLHIGDEVVRLGPGGLLAVPPNMRHYAVVVGDKPVINIDFFTPRREDYADSEQTA